MAEDIGSLVVRVAMDNSNFQDGINNLNRSIRKAQSEFKNATAGFKDHGKSLEGLKAKQELLSKYIEAQTKVVEKYKAKITESENTLKNNEIAHIKLKEKVENAKKAYEESSKKLGENSEETKKLKESYENLDKEYEASEEKLRNNVRTIDNWNIKANNAESKLKGMRQQLDSVSSSIEKQSGKWNKLSNKFKDFSAKAEKTSKKLGDIGKGLSTKVTAPLAALGAMAAKSSIDFSEGMAKVSTIADTTQVPIEKLRNGALKLSDDFATGAKEITESMYQAISASVPTGKAVEFVGTATKASVAGFTDAKTAVDGLSTVLNSYGLQTEKVNEIANQMLITQNKGKTSFGEIASSIGKVTPLSSQLNISTKELFGSLASTTAQGLATAESVTALKSAMSNIIKPSKEAAEAADALGIKFSVSKLKSKGWMPFLQDLKKGLEQSSPELASITKTMDKLGSKMIALTKAGKGNSKEYRQVQKEYKAFQKEMERMAKMADSPIGAMATMFGSVEGLNSILMLTSQQGMKTYDDTMKEMETNSHALDDAFNKMQNTTGAKIRKSLNKLKNVGIKFGDAIAPFIERFGDGLSAITDKLNQLSPAQIKIITNIAGMAMAIGPLFMIGSKLSKGLSGIAKVFSTVTKAMGVAKGTTTATTTSVKILSKVFTILNWKVALVVAAIAGAVYVGKKLHKHFTQASIQSQKFGNDISKSTQKALGEYEKLDKKVGQSLMNMRVNNSKVTKDMANDITSNFNNMSQQILAAKKKKYNDDYNNLKQFMTKNGGLREKEQNEILKKMRDRQKVEEESVKFGQKKINEIMKNASDNNRKVTDEEWHIIKTIRDNMNKDAIQSMSQSQREQKSLLERQKRNASILTAEQASDVVKNSAKQRDKVIKDAEQQYDKTVQNIQRQRDELGTITDEQAENLIKAAEHQKEVTVNSARGQHEEIVMEAQKQAKEHADKVDWETGEIKTKWQVMKEDVSKKAHETWDNVKSAFESKKQSIIDKAHETTEGIKGKWEKAKTDAKTWGSNIAENLKNGLESKKESIKNKANEIKEGIKEKFNNIKSEMKTIGQWAVEGLKKGLEFTKELKEKAEGLAKRTIAAVKDKLDIHSPSRVMQQLGKFTVEGFALGIEDSTCLAEEKAKYLADSVLKEVNQLSNLDIKIKANTNENEILKNTRRMLNWGSNNKRAYEEFLAFKDKLNKAELEQTKEYIKEDYETRNKALEDRIRILKNENTIELQTEKNRVDAQIAYYQKLQRNSKDKNAKKDYSNKIAGLRQYQKAVLNTTKANQKAQINRLETSKRALEEYYKEGKKLLENREKEVKNSEKNKQNIFKDSIITYDAAIKKLKTSTSNLSGELQNQKAIVIIQQQKIQELKNRYEELCRVFGATADETIQLRKSFEDANNELIEMNNIVKETESNIYNQQIDKINDFNSKIKEALSERYTQELKLEEEKFNKELNNLNNWKDESIKRIDDVYNAKIKALDDEIKAEDKAEQDRSELKKINNLKQAINFEHNEFNKVALQKELNKSIAERNKRLHREDIENKKLSLEQKKQNEINNINTLYEANKNNLEKQLSDTKKFYDQKLRMTNLQAEAEKIIIDNNQQEIVKLIKSYDKDYENAGKTLGQRLADGMKEKINPVIDMIASIEKRISALRTEELKGAINTAKYSPISSMGSGSINNSTTTNSKTVVNHNSITFNSPKALSPSEIRRNIETTLRNLSFSV
ncbi:phage tail tape measure protein [Clostridiaceae bacterium 14S0207]|nr:phage tail tape measure protein [Clostridiaceae bacterium 14S0207]